MLHVVAPVCFSTHKCQFKSSTGTCFQKKIQARKKIFYFSVFKILRMVCWMGRITMVRNVCESELQLLEADMELFLHLACLLLQSKHCVNMAKIQHAAIKAHIWLAVYRSVRTLSRNQPDSAGNLGDLGVSLNMTLQSLYLLSTWDIKAQFLSLVGGIINNENSFHLLPGKCKIWVDVKLLEFWPICSLCHRCKKHIKLHLAGSLSCDHSVSQEVWQARSHSDHSLDSDSNGT